MENKKILILIHSYHHKNTEKIAYAMNEILNADIKTIKNFKIEDTENYDLIGFGSGIAFGTHYKPLLKLAENLPESKNKTAFIFSTSGMANRLLMKKHHAKLRQCLTSKGYNILGEFFCKGYDTFSIFKLFGGINKNRPNEHDLKKAKEFAEKLLSVSSKI